MHSKGLVVTFAATVATLMDPALQPQSKIELDPNKSVVAPAGQSLQSR